MQGNDATDDEAHSAEGTVMRDKILHILEVCPKLTWSMLRPGVGPHHRGGDLREELEKLLLEGRVIREVVTKMAPSGRNITYDLYKLPEKLPDVEPAPIR